MRESSEFWGVVVLLTIILAGTAALLIRGARYHQAHRLTVHRKVLLSKVRGGLKSGDVILFISHAHGFTNSILTGDLYSHGGVVVDLDGELYLSESTVDTFTGADGEPRHLPESSQLNQLVPRLVHYRGTAFLMRLRDPLGPKQEETLRRRARETVPYPRMSHILGSLVGMAMHKRARHCMQHVAWLVDELGLTPDYLRRKDRTLLGTGFFASSRAVTTLPGKVLADGNRYQAIVEVVCDVDA